MLPEQRLKQARKQLRIVRSGDEVTQTEWLKLLQAEGSVSYVQQEIEDRRAEREETEVIE